MINSVYNTVKLIVNKDKYGEVTPVDFNLAAKEAQLTILVDLLDQLRRSRTKRGNSLKVREIEQVLDLFYVYTSISKPTVSSAYHTLPDDILVDNEYTFNTLTPISIVSKAEVDITIRNTITAPTIDNPIAYKQGNKLYVYPQTIGTAGFWTTDSVSVGYYKIPSDPALSFISGYTILDPSEPYDFTLPLNMHDKLTTEICKKFGVNLREEQVVLYANRESQDELTKENQ